MTGYTKLFSSIITSSVWQESNATRLVWITLLALADAKGNVEGAVPGLAHLARVSIEDCEKALESFRSPDPHSRTKTHDGRRIVDTDRGWLVLNYEDFRRRLSKEDRREYKRQKQREYRERDAKSPQESTDSTAGQNGHIAEAEAHTEAEAVPPKPPKRKRTPKETVDPNTIFELLPADFQQEAFQTVWQKFAEERNNGKHPLTINAIEAFARDFSKWGVVQVIAAINQSLQGGWRGVFPPRQGSTWNKPDPRKATVPAGLEIPSIDKSIIDPHAELAKDARRAEDTPACDQKHGPPACGDASCWQLPGGPDSPFGETEWE